MNTTIESFGLISPIGNKAQIWEILLDNKKTVVPLKSKNGINITALDINTCNDYIDPRFYRRMDKQVVYELMAGHNAVEDYPAFSFINKEKIGVYTGSLFAQLEFGMEQIRSLIEGGAKNNISMYTGVSFYYGAASGEMSILLKTKGENASICTGACSGIDCVIDGGKSISRRKNEVTLCIGGENLDEEVIPDMIPKYSESIFNKQNYFYSSGALCALLSGTENASAKNEIISTYVSSDNTSLFACSSNYAFFLEDSILNCLKLANIGVDDIDLVVPGLNNMFDYDLCELHVLEKLFSTNQEVVYTPIPFLGDMLSTTGILKIFVSANCMNDRIILGNHNEAFDSQIYERFSPLFSKATNFKNIRFSLIIQRDIIGGRISLIVLKNRTL